MVLRKLQIVFAAGAVAVVVSALWAQELGAGQAVPSPRDIEPVDFTGYWVSVITEDWRLRMLTAPKGDAAGVPLNADGTKAANEWDPAKDISSGEQCRAFGAGGVMRMPIRLHVTWQDEKTLKMEIDNGQQVRLFHFDRNQQPPAQQGCQGFSVANGETMGQGQGITPAPNGNGGNPGGALGPNAGGLGGGGRGGAGGGRGMGGGANALSGSFKVVTTNMRPGYMRRNGVRYTANAVLTEFFDRTEEPNGDSWLIVTSSLDDPKYLTMPFMTSTHFKREPDGSKFNLRPCEVTMPVDGVHGGSN